MRRFHLAAMLAAVLFAMPAAAQRALSSYPAASTLTGTEKLLASQGAGCATNTAPCTAVSVTPTQISTFIGGSFQPRDADLDAIAALATQSFGRALLTQADAASVRSYLGAAANGANTDITSITGSAARLTTGRTLSITGDLAWTSPAFDGSGAVTATGALAASGVTAGSYTSANITVDAKGRVTAAANGSGTDLTAWTTYTPTVTAGSGTITSATARGRYKVIGKTVHYNVFVNIANNGTGATSVNVTMPSTSAGITTSPTDRWTFTGREDLNSGFIVQGKIVAGTNLAQMYRVDNSYPGATGYGLFITGTYEQN